VITRFACSVSLQPRQVEKLQTLCEETPEKDGSAVIRALIDHATVAQLKQWLAVDQVSADA